MLKVYEWLVYIFMRPHKKFQHFIKWFDICFIRTKTNIKKKKKGKIKQKIEKNLPVAQAEPAQPAHPAHQGQGGLLPPPAPPSCSVECHRASWGRHLHAERLPGLPVPLLASWRPPSASAIHSPPPLRLPPPPAPISSPPEDRRGARRRAHVATVVPEPCRRVQENRSQPLHRSPQAIEPEHLSNRRQLHRELARPVSRRRQIPRLHSIPGLTVFSISFRVSFFTFPLNLQRLVCPTTESAMDPEASRRHGRR